MENFTLKKIKGRKKCFLVLLDIDTISNHNKPWSNNTFSFLFLVGDFIFTTVLLISFCDLPASSGGLHGYLKNKAGSNSYFDFYLTNNPKLFSSFSRL